MDDTETLGVKTTVCWVPAGRFSCTPGYADNADNINKEIEKKQQIADHIDSVLSKTKQVTNSEMSAYEKELDLENYNNDNNESADLMNLFPTSKQELDMMEQKDEFLEELSQSEDEFDHSIESHNHCVIFGAVENDDEFEYQTFVYNPHDEELYLNYSTMLDSPPLATVLLNPLEQYKDKCLLAVSSFKPIIEIYDNNVISALEPIAALCSESLSNSQGFVSLKVGLNNTLHSISKDGYYALWDICSKTLLFCEKLINEGELIAMDVTSDYFKCLISSSTGRLFIVDVNTFNITSTDVTDESIESVCAYVIEDSIVYLGTKNCNLIAYDYKKGAIIIEKTLGDSQISSIIQLKNTSIIIVVLEEGEVFIFDVKGDNCELVTTKNFHQSPILDIQAHPNDPALLCLAAPTPIIWNLQYDKTIQNYIERRGC